MNRDEARVVAETHAVSPDAAAAVGVEGGSQ